MLSEARINKIVSAMGTDEAKVKELVEMTPEAAAAKFAAMGYDFSAEELVEFGNYLAANVPNGEINENELDKVAGGIAAETLFVIGVIIGMTANKNNWRW